jgi:hypothetical protein
MLALRSLLALAAVAGVFGQSNTNGAINTVVSQLDIQIHHNIPNIRACVPPRAADLTLTLSLSVTMQANHTASDGTVGTQVNQMITAFNTATAGLAGIAVSAGSTTVKPTNDDISIVFSDVMQ